VGITFHVDKPSGEC